MNKNLALGLATLALSIANAPNAQAALINGVTASTNMTGSSGFEINNIANGSGLSSLSLTATHSQSSIANAWTSGLNPASTGNFTFNLNGLYSLSGLSVWNWNNNTLVGVKGVNVLTSTDGINFTVVGDAPTQFAAGEDPGPESPERFSFAPVSASYVRFNVLSNQGLGIGLSEVQFDGSPSATAVPEPLTIVGTLAGFGGGAALKLRLRGVKSKSV
ncbi:PEP-CTERM sorting domain-containing protein [Chamaesiphon sp.]|uniref:PEP-CTERM sorting domain-containing protein n=1 Tax=Chamaesiphon sp. TaxID=2814140 RepID=UPI00359435AF